jgi:acetyl esterase/lipase
MSPALPEHLDMAFGFSPPSQEGVAVVVLEYGLASERRNHYPTQLRQAVALLAHLLHVEKVPPACVTLVGDSAGGHLLLGLLLHASHPHPAVPALGLGGGRFAGAALVSPWVELEKPSFPSFYSSEEAEEKGQGDGGGGGGGGKRDIITPDSLAYWARNLLGGAEADPWNSPLSAPREWWADLPVEEVLVTYGGAELFRDDVARLADILRSEHSGGTTTVAACEGEIHVHMVMNRFLKIRKPCQSEEVFVRWLKGRGL